MIKRIVTILLALVLLVSVSAAFAEEVSDTLLVTVNGHEIRENDESLQYHLSDILYGEENPDDDYVLIARMYAMSQAIQEILIDEKIRETYSEEEIAAIKEEARTEWNEYIDMILMEDYGITENSSEEEKTAAREEVLSIMELYYGYTEEIYVDSAVSRAFSEKVIAELRAVTPDLAATEEEILSAYDDMVKDEMESLSGETGIDVAMYEFYQNYGYEFHFTPEGYKGVIHILLPVDAELLNNYNSLVARQEEGSEPLEATDGSETPAETEEPVTDEMVEEARQAILASKKDTIDEINTRLQNGESFESLIAEYGADPGMLNDTAAAEFTQGVTMPELYAKYGPDMLGNYAKTGYPVHPESIVYYPVFTEAAAKLEKVGDVGEPIVSSAGIHILYYLCDIPAGPMEMTEDVRAELSDSIESERLDLAISNLLEQWEAEADIVWTAEGEAWKYDESFVDAYRNSLDTGVAEDSGD